MLLLDTNVLLWLSSGNEQLGPVTRRLIDQHINEGTAHFSSISMWEVATLVRKQRYFLYTTVVNWRNVLIGLGLKEVPLDGSIALLAGSLTTIHGDPADRIIAATAMQLRAILMTTDLKLLSWTESSFESTDARK
ncbi:MAG TPA: PIN domain nuclease [Hyphomonadaceae bacterium]|nr:PIN domain nuclease [Hyphomonadaceae bacterium]